MTLAEALDPSPSPAFILLLSEKLDELKRKVTDNVRQFSYLVLARRKLDDGKLQGINPEWVEEFSALPEVSLVVVEADGAKGRSLKAPREKEPVVPLSTTLLVPVVGIDALDCPLAEPYVFRSEIAARILDLPLGSKVTPEVIARLLWKLTPKESGKARIIPFINKVDHPDLLGKARNVGEVLLRLCPGIERVLLGQALGTPGVHEILTGRGTSYIGKEM
ncbi:MAG: selenium cofactor biosynthesis protein YqeC [Deltaproteobacteria bacterium]|nr:selenium cofactor biosynthesis protein YqeC [Deltaproteobacteria bacterium]